MKIVSKEVITVVSRDLGLGFHSKREAESLRASVEMRRKYVRAELEKPLAAGVAAVLKEELSILNDQHDHIVFIKDRLQK